MSFTGKIYTLDRNEDLDFQDREDTINVLWLIEGDDVGLNLLAKHKADVIASIGTDNYISLFKNRFGDLMAMLKIEDLMRLSHNIRPESKKEWESNLKDTYERKILLRGMNPDDRDFYNQIGIEE